MTPPEREMSAGAPPAAGPDVVRSVRQRLLRGSAWTLGGRVSAVVLGLLINVILARLLAPAELGAYFATYTLVLVGSIVARLGMDRAAVRFISTAVATGKDGRARHVVRVVFLVGTAGALAVAAILVLGVGRWLAERVLGSELLADIVPLAAAWLVFTTVRVLMVETFRGFNRFDLATLFDSVVMDALAASVFAVLLVTGQRPGLPAIVGLSAVFAAVVAVVAGTLLVGRVRRLGREGRVERREVLAMSWPLVIADISSYLLSTGVDLWILGAFRPLSEVALYGAASRLIVFIVVPFHMVQGVTPPIIAELHARGRRAELQDVLRSGAFLAALPAFLLLLVFTFFGRSVLDIVFGPFYAQAATILAILSVGRLVAVWTGSCGVALIMTGHQRVMMTITVFSAVLSVTGALVAAPRYGAVGVAVTTAGAAIVQNLLQLFLARRYVGVWTQSYLWPARAIRYLRGRGAVETSSG